jgi:predicted HicB family RNase H-like nuclease
MSERRHRPRKQLGIEVTEEEHRMLKAFAAEAGVTMRKLVIQLLHREGVLTPPVPMQGAPVPAR